MSIRTALTKALARTEVPYELGNGNGVAIEQKAVPTLPVPFWPTSVWTSPLGVRQYTVPELTRVTAYAASALAYICMSYRADKLAEPPLSVVDVTDDGEEWLDDHELAAGVLSHPNADTTMSRQLHLTSLFRDITGSALWLKVRDRGKQTRRMYVYSGDDFTVESTDDRLFGKFRIRTKGDEIEAGPEDVIYFPGIDPWDPLGAVSPLDVALTQLGLGGSLLGSARTALNNAIQPAGAVSVPETLGPEEFEEMLGQLLQTHGGSANAGKPLILTGGATWQTIQWSLQEMMPTEVISWVEATVCAVFKIHPAVLGLKSGLDMSSGLSGARDKTAERMFYDNFAIPRWTADAEILTDQLLRDIDFDEQHFVRFYTDDIAALQDDKLELAGIIEKIKHAITINEQRQMMGYDPYPDAKVGETIFVPSTWMPAEMLVSGGLDLMQPRGGDNGGRQDEGPNGAVGPGDQEGPGTEEEREQVGV